MDEFLGENVGESFEDVGTESGSSSSSDGMHQHDTLSSGHEHVESISFEGKNSPRDCHYLLLLVPASLRYRSTLVLLLHVLSRTIRRRKDQSRNRKIRKEKVVSYVVSRTSSIRRAVKVLGIVQILVRTISDVVEDLRVPRTGISGSRTRNC